MIDLSKYEAGQRFTARGGWPAKLLGLDAFGRAYMLEHAIDHYFVAEYHFENGQAYDGRSTFDLICPRVPHNASKPRAPLMPTGYAKQWPHLYQFGGAP